MISFEQFEKYMNYLRRSAEFSDKLYGIIKKYKDVLQDADPGIPVANDYIVELLELAFELKVDEYGYTTLSWWIYCAEFGTRKDILESFELGYLPEDHKYRHPKLNTYRELYDFLSFKSEYKSKSDKE